MEEKLRYCLIGYCSYRDTETGVIGDNFVDLLNQQDKRIKELEENLAKYEKDKQMWEEMYKDADRINKNICETDIYPLQEENQQLKAKYDNLYKCYQKTSQEDLKDKYDLAEENKELKEQLAKGKLSHEKN